MDLDVKLETRNILTGHRVDWNETNGKKYQERSKCEVGDLTLAWKDLSVWRQKKIGGSGLWSSQHVVDWQILHEVSGEVTAGNLIAVMGASGSGKTTLLAAISRRDKGDISGVVTLNGRVVSRELMARVSGFVPQRDIVVEDLTVRQHMEFMARLMMDKRCNKLERNKRINQLLLSLNLQHSKETILKSLSGGEKKRLALAVQLLNDPPILFCDEATTGLDSWAAKAVVTNLRKLASLGKIIICSIHQPASGVFELFHEVIFLAGGRIAYQGSVRDCTRFFDELNLQCPMGYNRAEFFVSQLAVKVGEEFDCHMRILKICEHYQKKLQEQKRSNAKYPKVETNYDFDDGMSPFAKYLKIEKVGFLTQWNWLFWRNLISYRRNYSIIVAEFIVYLFVALTCSLPFSQTLTVFDQASIQNLQGLLYLIVCETIFLFIYAVWVTFPSEIPVLLRESANGLYSPGPYYLAKIVVWIPRSVVKPTIFSAFVFYWVGLRGGVQKWLSTTMILILTANFANAYGSVLSASFEKLEVATLVSVCLEAMGLIFSGVMINLNSVAVPFDLLKYISPFYYGVEAVSILQWTEIDNISCTGTSLPCITNGLQVLDSYGYKIDYYYIDIGGLVLLYIFCHAIAFLMVKRRSRNSPVY